MSDRSADVRSALLVLDEHGDSSDWVGPDPYEGLNAHGAAWLINHSPIGARILIQAVKRSPLNLRPLLGIRPTPNSTTNAWVLSAYAGAQFLTATEQSDRVRRAVDRLVQLRSPRFEENAWGYLFPTQSRVFFYDRNTPATVTTVWAGHALADAAAYLDDDKCLEQATSAARFLVTQVPQTPDSPGAYFGYLADDSSPIHNSNLHACALLARIGALTGDPMLVERAAEGVRWSLARQRVDGSWPYGETPGLSWVDGFHTGYVLEALDTYRRYAADDSVSEAWTAGLAYYRDQLFLRDGTPKYYSDSVYPIDASCVAQAIQTFAIASDHDVAYLDQAGHVFDWALANIRRSDGLFMFQRRRYWSNRIPHMRWAQAAMFLALSHLLRRLDSCPVDATP